MTAINPPTVLVVENEPDLAEMYAEWLEDTYTVHTAYDGRQALALLNENVEVVLLDRLMPGLSGDLVLETIRDREIECRVALVTAVKPGFDILELGFDDYLVKPVTEGDLYQTVETLLTRAQYTQPFREYHATAGKQAILETERTDAELAASDEYAELTAHLTELRGQLAELETRWVARTGVATVFRRLSHHIRHSQADDDA